MKRVTDISLWLGERGTRLVLALTLALAAVLRVLSFRGYATHDASAYAQLAHMMVSGGFKPGMMWYFPVFSVRVGLFAPAALAFRLGGVNEVTLTLYPFLLSMSGVVLAYFAAKAMFSRRAGLIAACLTALLPIDARYASQLMPDLPAALYMNAGLLLVYAGARAEAASRKLMLGVVAGLAFFLSWLCKETVLYLVPFVGLYTLWLVRSDRRNLSLLAACIAAAALLVGLEGWVYQRATGDYLFRLTALSRNADNAKRALSVFSFVGVVRYFVGRTSDLLQSTLLNLRDFALIPGAALVACVYALARRSRRFLFPALWFGWMLLMFGFGSASLGAYVPLHLIAARFQLPLLLPAILLVAGLASELVPPVEPGVRGKSGRRRFLLSSVMLFYLFCILATDVTLGIQDGMGRRCRVPREMARTVKPADLLYTDGVSAAALRFYWKYPAADSTHDFAGMSAAQIPAGAHVLLDRKEVAMIQSIDKYIPPTFLDSVPASWQRLRHRDDATLYRVPAPLPLNEAAAANEGEPGHGQTAP
jgi:hypothetical protein